MAATALNNNSDTISDSPLSKPPSAGGFALPDPANVSAKVGLSGNIISATFLTPYTIGYRRRPKDPAADPPRRSTWELTPRRGSSALYDTLKNLASAESEWSHTIVGWTGEVAEISATARTHPLQHLQNSRTAQMGNPPPATGAAAGRPAPLGTLMSRSKSSCAAPPPVPVFEDGGNRMTMKADHSRDPIEEEHNPGANKEERDGLQTVLAHKCRDAGWDKIRAVWLGDEDDEGGIAFAGMDRWMVYAEKGP